jgi:hypothetical protein
MSTEVSMYALAARDAGYDLGGTLFDVWRRPQIKPKMLSQADTTKFLESGEYYGTDFNVEVVNGGAGIGIDQILVDDTPAEIKLSDAKPTKKNPDPPKKIAIRETPEMFGARLLSLIYEEPEKYFVRKEIARTDKDLRKFEKELWAVYQTIKRMEEMGHWWQDESQCEATYKCDYCPICYSNRDVFNGQTPAGFRRYKRGEK